MVDLDVMIRDTARPALGHNERLVAQNELSGVLRRYRAFVNDDDLPMDTSRDLFYFTEGALAYAGYYVHDEPNPLHSHSFVEIAFVTSGTATHLSRRGREDLRVGDVILLRPGVWHGYDDCHRLTLYNCCFSSDLLRQELAWTREDPLLGYLLWTGPYSAQARGILTAHLDRETLEQCKVHLAALDALRGKPVMQYQGDIVGRLALLFSLLGRTVAQTHAPLPGAEGPAHPAI